MNKNKWSKELKEKVMKYYLKGNLEDLIELINWAKEEQQIEDYEECEYCGESVE